MPSSSQLCDCLGANPSSEEAKKQSSTLPLTDISLRAHVVKHAALEQEIKNRTYDVRERLGPLIERLKNSVTNIQTLESSMRLSGYGDDNSRGNCEMTKEGQDTRIRNAWSSGQSRSLTKKTMEMVKKKMFQLKIMEEELAASEKRRVNLHHYFQQRVASQDIEAPRVARTNNLQYENRIAELKEKIFQLKEKSIFYNDLRVQNDRLLEKTKHVDSLESELERERSLRISFESKLQEDQYKTIQQALKYDSLDCKFEVLTKSKDNSNLNLKQDIIDTITLHRRYLANNKGLPQRIMHLGTNESDTLTEPISLSWTESSISNDTNAVEDDDSSGAGESYIPKEESASHSTVQLLRSKVESLNRENAELRESKSHTLNKYKSLREEMTVQSSMIKYLLVEGAVLRGKQS